MWATRTRTSTDATGGAKTYTGSGSRQAAAVANQIPLATNGLADANVPASEPQWDLVLTQNPVSSAWSGTQVQQDFNVQCSEFGKIQNVLLQFTATFTTAAGSSTRLTSTPYWVDRIDFFLPDGSIMETLYDDEIFVDTCSMLTDQEVDTVAPLYNLNTDMTKVAYELADPLPAATANTRTFWMSLNSSFFTSCQPYLKGMGNGYFKIRLYYSSSIVGSGAPLTSVTNLVTNLWVQQAVLARDVEQALDQLHNSSGGAVYNSIVRNEINLNLTDQVANGNQVIQLQGFNCQAAALYFQFKVDNTAANTLNRIEVASMYLQDAGGKQITQNFPVQLIEAIIAPQVVPVSSYFINSGSTTYLFPFCTNLQRCIDSGRKLGSYALTGNERVNITLGATPFASGNILNVIAYQYASMYVKNGKVKMVIPGSSW
jgi:hypothetical protein